MSDPRFGFDDIVTDNGLGEVRGNISELDRLGDRHGFVSRQPPDIAIKRQRGTEDTIHQFTMRVRIKASNRFVRWCERERLSYREGFDRLVAHLDEEG
jgi:hypothetical protein